MVIGKNRLKYSEVTPKNSFLNRRNLIKTGLAFSTSIISGSGAQAELNLSESKPTNSLIPNSL